jgi:hypothetical protein
MQVLLNHLHLCFGTHMAVMVSCVVYVTAKIIQTPLSFSTITQVRNPIPGPQCVHLAGRRIVTFCPAATCHMRAYESAYVEQMVCNALRASSNPGKHKL